MPEIARLFHGSQIVHDVLEVGRFYHDFFGSWVYEAQQLRAEDGVNSANVIGDFSLEMIAPIDPAAPTPIARFLRRHGPHFSNIAFWVRDCRGLARQLLERGVRVSLRGLGIVDRVPEEPFDYAITHPKDTGAGVLEFLEEQPIHDPRHQEWWSPSFWRDRHPLGIEGLSHCTVVVAELERAAQFYGEVLGSQQLWRGESRARDAQSIFFSVGDSVIELAQPTSPDSDLGRHLEAHGPIVYGFTFEVRDLQRVIDHARDHGRRVIERGPGRVELDPTESFGGVFGFRERGAGGMPWAA